MAALRPAAFLALAVAGLVFAVSTGHSALAVVGAGLGAWLVAGSGVDLWQRAGGRAARLARLPGADWGRAVAHAGLGVTFIGISLLMAWQVEDIRVAQVGDRLRIAGYDVTLQDVAEVQGPNYVSTTATMLVERAGRRVGVLHPEKRVYPVQAMPSWVQAVAQLLPVYWIGLGLRHAMLPPEAVALEIGESWRVLETVAMLGGWAVLGLVVAPIALRRMARRQSGSLVAAARGREESASA